MTIKAQITQVNLGHIQIEGLLGSDGKFYVAVSQIAEHLQLDGHNAVRDIKALMGSRFQFVKAITPGSLSAVNIVTLDDFRKILMEFAFNGNLIAQNLFQDTVSFGLRQLFSDASNIRNTQK